MARKEYEMLFKLSASGGSQFSGTFKAAQASIASMQNELQVLKKAQSDISAFQKYQGSVETTKVKLENLKAQHELIQREIAETDGSTAALEREELKLQQRITNTTATMESQQKRADSMGEALRDAGIDTGNLTAESKRLENQYSSLKTKQQGVIDGLGNAADSADGFGKSGVQAVTGIQEALVAAGIAKAIKEIGEAMVDCTKESIAFESAVTGVYKTVDGTDAQLAAISDEIKELSTEIPATTEEIAAVAEAAGQLGIATENVMEFSEVMIDLGESTNLASEEAASSLAKFTNITKTAANDYSRLGSVIVDLGNKHATTEADIVAMGTRLASAGTLAGLTEAEILALSAAMSSVGIEAEAGGTAMTQTLSAIEKAVVNGGDTLYEFARIADMSAAEFAEAWNNSPINAIQAFIAGIGRLDEAGESAVLVLDDLGLSGVRQSNMIKSLGLAADTLAGAVDTANTAWDENIALQVEAGKRYATTESRLAMLGNSYSNLKVAIGDVYTPALKKSIGIGQEALEGITEFVEDHPGAVRGLTAVTVGVGGFTAALTAYTVGAKVAAVASAALNAAVNPIGFVITGAAVALAALALTAEDDAVPSVRELTEATREMHDVMGESAEVYNDTVDSTMAAASVADEYITALEQMEAAGINTDEQAKDYHNTLALLCQVVPELAGQIDLETDTIEGGTEALRENTEAWKKNAIAQAYQTQINGLYEAYADVLVEAKTNELGLAEAQRNTAKANEKYSAALQRMDVLWNEANAAAESSREEFGTMTDATAFLTQEYYDLENSLGDLRNEIQLAEQTEKNYREAIEAGSEATEAARHEIELAEQAVKELTEAESGAAGGANNLSDSQQVVLTTAAEMQTVMEGVTAEMEQLAAAYTEAYNSARESLSGQYALWDEAADRAAISTDDMNAAMSGQVEYWQEYNRNLDSLAQRSKDIEGLSDVIASFADGSAESVNAVAGMAAANDTDLKAMVENWQALQREHSKAADSIALLQTDFANAMNQMQTEMQAAVEAMNLSEDAAISGEATIQGFIDAADSQLWRVHQAYSRVSQVAVQAMNGSVYNVPPVVTDIPGAASGTLSARSGITLVGENGPELVNLKGGERIYNAAETTAILSGASGGSYGGNTVQLNITVHGNASEDTVQQLRDYGDDLTDKIITILTDLSMDSARRRYD